MIPLLSRAISECFRDEVLYNKPLYKSTLLCFILLPVSIALQQARILTTVAAVGESHCFCFVSIYEFIVKINVKCVCVCVSVQSSVPTAVTPRRGVLAVSLRFSTTLNR